VPYYTDLVRAVFLFGTPSDLGTIRCRQVGYCKRRFLCAEGVSEYIYRVTCSSMERHLQEHAKEQRGRRLARVDAFVTHGLSSRR
jgi:hypothetical protein